MKNIKTKSYMLGLFTLVTLGVTYAYTSVSSSLTYLRGAGDTGHIGYIITEIFGTTGTSSGKIKQEYLDLTGYVTETGSAPVTSVNTKTGAVTISKGDVGLGNVDNTSDINKPISTATQTALNGKAGTSVATTSVNGLMSSIDKTKLDGIATGANNYTHPSGDGNLHVPVTSTTNSGRVLTAGPTAGSLSWQVLPTAPVSSVAGKTGTVTLVKGDVGLGNVDNTSDINKPISTATQTALDGKANIASPNFTGTPKRTTAPTDGDASNELATTARVKANTVSAGSSSTSSPTCYYTTLACDSNAKLLDGVYTAGGAANVNHNICCFMGGTISPLASICASDTLGLTCTGNVKNMGIFNGYRYMTTPGNCTNSATPTCNGSNDTITQAWGTHGVTTYMNSNDGAYNTMILAGYVDTSAAKYCDAMVYGGFSDWYLPSKEELMYMYKIRNSIGGFAVYGSYWSSTEDNNNNAWYQSLYNGVQSTDIKYYNTYLVRCIRKY